MQMLEQILEASPPLLAAHAAALTGRLNHDDAAVRQFVVRSIPKLGQDLLVTASLSLIEHLGDPSRAVRSAVVDVMASLPVAVLANHTLSAVERLQQQGDPELSYAAITSWSEPLGNGDWPEAMAVLGGLQFSLGRSGREWERGGPPEEGVAIT